MINKCSHFASTEKLGDDILLQQFEIFWKIIRDDSPDFKIRYLDVISSTALAATKENSSRGSREYYVRLIYSFWYPLDPIKPTYIE